MKYAFLKAAENFYASINCINTCKGQCISRNTLLCVCVYLSVFITSCVNIHCRIYLYICLLYIWKNIFVFVESWSSVHIQMQILTLRSMLLYLYAFFSAILPVGIFPCLFPRLSSPAVSPMKWR